MIIDEEFLFLDKKTNIDLTFSLDNGPFHRRLFESDFGTI